MPPLPPALAPAVIDLVLGLAAVTTAFAEARFLPHRWSLRHPQRALWQSLRFFAVLALILAAGHDLRLLLTGNLNSSDHHGTLWTLAAGALALAGSRVGLRSIRRR